MGSTSPAVMARPRQARPICRRQILCPGHVNPTRKRAIVWSTIAATFTFIRRSHDRAGRRKMTEAEPPGEQGNRSIDNVVWVGFVGVLVAAGVWLLATMADVGRAEDCAAQDRRNCASIEIPDRP